MHLYIFLGIVNLKSMLIIMSVWIGIEHMIVLIYTTFIVIVQTEFVPILEYKAKNLNLK